VDLKRIHDISLKWKLLIPFLLLSFAGTFFLILFNLHSQIKLIKTHEREKLNGYYQAFSDQIEDRKRAALSLAYAVAGSTEIQEAFSRRDKTALIRLLSPVYEILARQFDVKQLHFHVPPATSFLRLHRPQQYGEHMAAYRHTINRVEETHEGIAGLEWGATGFGVRGVAPVFHKKRFIGTFEVGFSVEQPFLESLKARYPMHIALLVPVEGHRDFAYLATSSQALPRLPGPVYARIFATQNSEVLTGPPEAPSLAILLGPLRDFSGKSIGVVEIGVDRTATLAEVERNRNVLFMILGGALVVSSVLIWWIAALFLRPVRDIVEAAREIATGRRVKTIEVRVHDEIGTLADSLNEMLASLSEARHEVQAYCDTLEERVRARTVELVEQKEKFETLVESAPLIVYRLMPDGSTVYVNRFVEELLGYTPTEVIDDGNFWVRAAHPEDRPRLETGLKTCLEQGQELQLEYRGLNKNGYEIFLLNHALPLVDDEGRLHAIDGIIVDVTERKRLQEKIIQTEELKTLSEVSARLAHEIRNPLTSAGGFARRLLQETAVDDPQRRKLEIIVYELGRLEQILRMILAYIRPVSMEFSEVDLNGVLKEAVKAAEAKINSRGIALEIEHEGTGLSVRADRGQLRQAMQNIIQTACDRTPRDARLRIRTSRNGAAVVQFSYPGLHTEDDDIDHFFYPFVPDELAEMNLELPLAKVVLHRHGGIIAINRDKENQVNITITLPLATKE
jgi:PAS domain S-box-containing protein